MERPSMLYKMIIVPQQVKYVPVSTMDETFSEQNRFQEMDQNIGRKKGLVDKEKYEWNNDDIEMIVKGRVDEAVEKLSEFWQNKMDEQKAEMMTILQEIRDNMRHGNEDDLRQQQLKHATQEMDDDQREGRQGLGSRRKSGGEHQREVLPAKSSNRKKDKRYEDQERHKEADQSYQADDYQGDKQSPRTNARDDGRTTSVKSRQQAQDEKDAHDSNEDGFRDVKRKKNKKTNAWNIQTRVYTANKDVRMDDVLNEVSDTINTSARKSYIQRPLLSFMRSRNEDWYATFGNWKAIESRKEIYEFLEREYPELMSSVVLVHYHWRSSKLNVWLKASTTREAVCKLVDEIAALSEGAWVDLKYPGKYTCPRDFKGKNYVDLTINSPQRGDKQENIAVTANEIAEEGEEEKKTDNTNDTDENKEKKNDSVKIKPKKKQHDKVDQASVQELREMLLKKTDEIDKSDVIESTPDRNKVEDDDEGNQENSPVSAIGLTAELETANVTEAAASVPNEFVANEDTNGNSTEGDSRIQKKTREGRTPLRGKRKVSVERPRTRLSAANEKKL